MWIEIGILNIHFGHIFPLPFSLFSSLVSHFLSTPMLAVGWCLWYPNTSWLLWMLCSTFLSFLSFLTRALSLQTLNVCVFECGLKLEYWIFTLHIFPLPFSLFSLPFHSDLLTVWMVYSGSEVFVFPNTSSAFGMLCSTFLSFLSFLNRVLSLQTLNEFGGECGLKLGYWIFTLHIFPLPFSLLSLPFHSDV